MKKSLLALAVLGAFSSIAAAQSSVTLYGRVDLAVGKASGREDKVIGNGSGSRLGVRGVEDLGGGLQALFNLEHRYDADTGSQTNLQALPGAPAGTVGPGRFWTGRSIVGLQGGFGQIVLGREYTTAFLQSQLVADPWGWDTVVAGGQYGGASGTQGTTGLTGGGIATVRNDSSATYKITVSGFTFGAQIAEATDTFTQQVNKPWNLALSYSGGPITGAIAHERTGAEAAETAQWTTINLAYNFGAFKLGGLYGKGNTATDIDRTSWMLTATAPIGAGELRAVYGVRESEPAGGASVKDIKTFGIGYHYSLSKRTTLYADVANNKGTLITDEKTGYDIGIKHNF